MQPRCPTSFATYEQITREVSASRSEVKRMLLVDRLGEVSLSKERGCLESREKIGGRRVRSTMLDFFRNIGVDGDVCHFCVSFALCRAIVCYLELLCGIWRLSPLVVQWITGAWLPVRQFRQQTELYVNLEQCCIGAAWSLCGPGTTVGRCLTACDC